MVVRTDGLMDRGRFASVDSVRRRIERLVGDASDERGGTEEERRRLVAAVKNALDELRAAEDEIRRREYELQEQAATEARDDFLATLSHELRTPLNVILGWTEMLRNEGLDAESSDLALGSIERNAKQLNQLVDDLLSVSRERRIDGALDMSPCELHRILTEAIDMVWPSAAARDIHLRAILSDAGSVVADAERLRQSFVNLLSNAAKFSPEGGTIDVEVRRVGRALEIRVRDDGIGIPADLLPHVFDRFRQGEPAPERLNEGVGLGLSVVRDIVAAHGGDVWAESAGEGHGATFTVRLPLALGELAQPAADAAGTVAGAPPQAEAPRAGALDGLLVLVAGLPGERCGRICETLARAGAQVVRTGSEADALERAAEDPPDALIVAADAARSESFFGLARQLEERFSGRLPVVALTPPSGPERDWNALDAALQLYLPMPSDLARVVPLVGAVARLSGSGR